MAVSIFWPPSLPQIPLREGHIETVCANIQRVEMDKGQAKERYLGLCPEPMPIRMLMTLAQWEALREFALDTTVGGDAVVQVLVPVFRERQMFEYRLLKGL